MPLEVIRLADREKAILGLECCLETIDDESCPEICPYYSECMKYKKRCIFQYVMKDALALLKAQEARVMTLEEIEDALDNVVWLDIPGAENLADGFSLIMAYSRKNGFVLLDSPFGDNPSQDRFEYTDYNKTWRCWTARPTDEQREAVKWDG